MIIVDSPGMLVTWDSKNGWVRFEFRGFVENETYRRPLEEALKFLSGKKITKILWDLRAMKVLTPEDQTWAERDWTPRLVKETRVKRSAVLVPKSVLANMSLKRVADRAASVMKDELDTKHFDSIEELEKWLRAID